MRSNFYVYVYLDPRKLGEYKYGDYTFYFEPFYIGKGTGKRIDEHLKCNDKCNEYNSNKIKKMFSAGLEPIRYKLIEDQTEDEALKIEIELIKLIGRKSSKTGPLTNFTDGGEGVSGRSLGDIVQYDLSNNYVATYKSMSYAASTLGIDHRQISLVCKGVRASAGGFIFKYADRSRIKKVVKGFQAKKTYKYDKQTEKLLKEYQSCTEAEREHRLCSGAISSACNGRTKTSGGFKWSYQKANYYSQIN